jgi:hypothetical protein
VSEIYTRGTADVKIYVALNTTLVYTPLVNHSGGHVDQIQKGTLGKARKILKKMKKLDKLQPLDAPTHKKEPTVISMKNHKRLMDINFNGGMGLGFIRGQRQGYRKGWSRLLLLALLIQTVSILLLLSLIRSFIPW